LRPHCFRFHYIKTVVRARSPISTQKRLQYARGYIGLGLINEANEELEAIEGDARISTEVLRVRIDLSMEAKQWDLVVNLARPVAVIMPEDEQVWISWAYALRELDQITEAEEVLLKAEKVHGHKSAILHYNLACYACLLGHHELANQRLKQAIKLDKQLEDEWDKDPDLKALTDIF
jgi:tetratricopeptide (TPR) repeat protein